MTGLRLAFFISVIYGVLPIKVYGQYGTLVDASGFDQESILLLQDVQNRLQSFGAAPKGCDISGGNLCSVSGICRALEPNKDSRYLIDNGENKKIINEWIYDLDHQVKSCLAAAKASAATGSQTADMAAFAQKKQKFYEAVLKAGQEREMVRVELELNKNAAQPYGGSGYIGDQDQKVIFANKIREAMGKAGVTLTEPVIAAWIGYLVPYGPSPYDLSPTNHAGPTPIQSIYSDDPFINPSLLDEGSPGQREKYRRQVRDRNAEINALVNSTKQKITNILNARRNSKNTAQIDIMIKRIETVSWNDSQLARSHPTCDIPNAFYNPLSHSLTVCDNHKQSAALAQTIAHEIGHAIDPCQISYPLFAGNEGNFQVDGRLPEDKILIDQGVGFRDNPFSKILSCLGGESSVRALTPPVKETSQALQSKRASLIDSGYRIDSSEIQEIDAALDILATQTNPGCNTDGLRPSQMGEAFADWIAVEVWASDSAAIDKETLFSNAARYAAPSCGSVQPSSLNSLRNDLLNSGCMPQTANGLRSSVSKLTLDDETTHPHDFNRIFKIIFAHPKIKEALNCPATSLPPVEYCHE